MEATTTVVSNASVMFHVPWTMTLVLVAFTAYLSTLAYKNYKQAKNLG